MDNVAINKVQPDSVAMRMRAGSTVNDKTLRAMLLPYQGGRAVLPHNLVVEVLPYAPSLGVENAPPWVIGSMLWKAQPLPLVSLEFLAAYELPETGTHNRIIVVQAINNHPKLRHFGFVGSEAPRMIEISRENISKEVFADTRSGAGVASRVLIDGQPAIIPDLDSIEQALSDVINSARTL